MNNRYLTNLRTLGIKIKDFIGTYVEVFYVNLRGMKGYIGMSLQFAKYNVFHYLPRQNLMIFLIKKIKDSPHIAFELLQYMPPKALVGGFLVQVLWTQRPLYQKLAIIIIGLRIVYYSIRGIMLLCIKIHNNLYYPYQWLNDGSIWVMIAPFRFIWWIMSGVGGFFSNIINFIKDTIKDTDWKDTDWKDKDNNWKG